MKVKEEIENTKIDWDDGEENGIQEKYFFLEEVDVMFRIREFEIAESE